MLVFLMGVRFAGTSAGEAGRVERWEGMRTPEETVDHISRASTILNSLWTTRHTIALSLLEQMYKTPMGPRRALDDPQII